MLDSDGIERRWAELREELRRARDEHRQAWGDLDDVLIARYVLGEGSREESESVDDVLTNHRAARRAIDLLRGIRSEWQSRWNDELLLAAAACAADASIARLVQVDCNLVDSVGAAQASLAEERAGRIADAIQLHDPLFVMAAGSTDEIARTSPIWYTRLRDWPRSLSWPASAAEGPWNVMLSTLGGDPFLTRVCAQPPLDLSDLNPTELPRGLDITWKAVSRQEAGRTLRGVFAVAALAEREAMEDETRRLNTQSAGFERDLAVIAALTARDFFHEALELLAAAAEVCSAPEQQFVLHRAAAAIFGAEFRRLNGPPYWMGDPEAVWASKLADEHLCQGWKALGVDYAGLTSE